MFKKFKILLVIVFNVQNTRIYGFDVLPMGVYPALAVIKNTKDEKIYLLENGKISREINLEDKKDVKLWKKHQHACGEFIADFESCLINSKDSKKFMKLAKRRGLHFDYGILSTRKICQEILSFKGIDNSEIEDFFCRKYRTNPIDKGKTLVIAHYGQLPYDLIT